jgi:type II secretory pathway pseudopilin PulG
MWPRSDSSAQGGFTLVEVLVVLISLTVILTLAGQLLFASKRLAVRQGLQVEARETARGAVDYAAFMLRGATDFNQMGGNAGAIMVWLYKQDTGSYPSSITCPGDDGCFQATYNNVTDASLADPGTDIITFSRPNNTRIVKPVTWPGYQNASNVDWFPLDRPCTDSAAMLQTFKDLTGAHGPAGQEVSDVLFLVDESGNFRLYQITDYQDGSNANCCDANSNCQDANGVAQPCIKVVSNAGQSGAINPPGTQPDLVKPDLVLGARFVSLRVRNGWLEQKDGIFDPAVDNPGNNFVPILPNVEDLQIAWFFRNGEIWNSAPGHTLAVNAFGVPAQGTTGPYDVTNVMGVRVTVTTRSSEPMTLDAPRFGRPVAEDHTPGGGKDALYRYQASASAMLRNRMAGS